MRGDQDGELPAVAGQPARRRAGHVQRPTVPGHDLFQDLLDGADVHACPVVVGQRHPVTLGHVLVYQQALCDLARLAKPRGKSSSSGA